MLEGLNALSRKICSKPPTLAEFECQIRELKNKKAYPEYIHILSQAVGAGGFAFFFGGNYKDALVAFVIGVLIALIERYAPERMTGIARTFASAFIASALHTKRRTSSLALPTITISSIVQGQSSPSIVPKR